MRDEKIEDAISGLSQDQIDWFAEEREIILEQKKVIRRRILTRIILTALPVVISIIVAFFIGRSSVGSVMAETEDPSELDSYEIERKNQIDSLLDERMRLLLQAADSNEEREKLSNQINEIDRQLKELDTIFLNEIPIDELTDEYFMDWYKNMREYRENHQNEDSTKNPNYYYDDDNYFELMEKYGFTSYLHGSNILYCGFGNGREMRIVSDSPDCNCTKLGFMTKGFGKWSFANMVAENDRQYGMIAIGTPDYQSYIKEENGKKKKVSANETYVAVFQGNNAVAKIPQSVIRELSSRMDNTTIQLYQNEQYYIFVFVYNCYPEEYDDQGKLIVIPNPLDPDHHWENKSEQVPPVNRVTLYNFLKDRGCVE